MALLAGAGARSQPDREQAALEFRAGRTAFDAQDYASALGYFEAALHAGLASPAVHFNIGVAAYRLGRYPRAQQAFAEVARTPAMAALAHYNLGLVALAAGERTQAGRWFAAAERETADDRLRSLASAQLAQLRGTPAPAERSWVGYAALAAGYDDNVALIADSDVLGVSGSEDGFGELQLAFSTPLGEPWRLDAGLVWVKYQELDAFDQLSVHSGGRYRLTAGDWTHEAALQLAYTTLDTEGFESRQTLALQTSTALFGEWRLRGRYRFSSVEGLNEFEALGGQRHEASARAAWSRRDWQLGIEYQLDVNEYDDDALSSDRRQIGLDVQYALPAGWEITFDAIQRHTRYDLASSGSEERTELGLGITRILTPLWRLTVRYAYADNDADLPELNYMRSRIVAVIEALL